MNNKRERAGWLACLLAGVLLGQVGCAGYVSMQDKIAAQGRAGLVARTCEWRAQDRVELARIMKGQLEKTLRLAVFGVEVAAHRATKAPPVQEDVEQKLADAVNVCKRSARRLDVLHRARRDGRLEVGQLVELRLRQEQIRPCRLLLQRPDRTSLGFARGVMHVEAQIP